METPVGVPVSGAAAIEPVAKTVFSTHLFKTVGETLGIAVLAYILYLLAQRILPKSWAKEILGTISDDVFSYLSPQRSAT